MKGLEAEALPFWAASPDDLAHIGLCCARDLTRSKKPRPLRRACKDSSVALRLISLVLVLPVTLANVCWASRLDRNVAYIAES